MPPESAASAHSHALTGTSSRPKTISGPACWAGFARTDVSACERTCRRAALPAGGQRCQRSNRKIVGFSVAGVPVSTPALSRKDVVPGIRTTPA